MANKGQNCGKANGNWRGGRYLNDDRYWMILKPEHSRASSRGYIFEHIVIAEKMLGRPLRKDEEVHHMGRRDDNTRIKVCKDRAEHVLLHIRLRAVRAGALPSYRKCSYCKKYDKPSNMYYHHGHTYHKFCRNNHLRKAKGGIL